MRPLPNRDGTFGGRAPQRPDSLTCPPSSAPVACFITSEANIDAVRDRSRTRLRHQPDRRKQQPVGPNQLPSPTRTDSASSLGALDVDVLQDTSQPGTPVLTGISGPESALSSTSSRRSSFAVSSVEYQSSRMEGMDILSHHGTTDDGEVRDGSGPQLIMPSLVVPRRRPFSDVGKLLGKLKIMVAGRPGIGKTSLIRSLAQRCEHIVHIDPIVPTTSPHAAEIYASSRPHPWWRVDPDFVLSAERRRSSTGEMLDRNVCFVECPSHQATSPPSLRYLESHLSTLLAKPMDDSDLLALVNAGGEPIVDALLYLIPNEGLAREDVEFIKNAQTMTNVIPVLARSDELDGQDIDTVKQNVTEKLAAEGLDCFSFADPESLEDAMHVYAVSTETQVDYDLMDASILMNSAYMPPLVPTDLSQLVDRIFSLDGSARLRHCAAIKCIRWRRDHSQGLVQRTVRGPSTGSGSYSEPVYMPHPFFHSRCWEPVDLYNWASSLRSSLHTERLQHLMMASPDTNPSAPESRLVPLSPRDSRGGPQNQRRKKTPRHQDPLGLLELGGQLKQKGMLALEMLSSLGLISYVISRLTIPSWPAEGAFGILRVSIDVAGFGALSVLST